MKLTRSTVADRRVLNLLPAVLYRLASEGATDLSYAEIRRCVAMCAGPNVCESVARYAVRHGMLTLAELAIARAQYSDALRIEQEHAARQFV